jgi:cytidyltransferase-like protein
MPESGLTTYRAAQPDELKRRAMRIMRRTCGRQEKHFDSFEELVQVVEQLRAMGCVIVLTMGTWDLFHIGHADYIAMGKEEARNLYPDAEQVIQVVAVDSDDLTRERKGPKRPVADERERSSIIAHLDPVDIVTIEREYRYLHRHLPHDVRVISTSTSDMESEAEMKRYCANLVNLPPQAQTSTTARLRMLVLEERDAVLDRFEEGVGQLIKEVRDGLQV